MEKLIAEIEAHDDPDVEWMTCSIEDLKALVAEYRKFVGARLDVGELLAANDAEQEGLLIEFWERDAERWRRAYGDRWLRTWREACRGYARRFVKMTPEEKQRAAEIIVGGGDLSDVIRAV